MVLVLVNKIASLAIMLLVGALVVRLGILKSDDSIVLSNLTLWVICPCMLITAFQVEFTEDVRDGLMLALFAAFVINVGLVLSNIVLRRVFGLTPVEQCSVVYSNAGNLIVPLVTALLGPDWVIYSSAFMMVQTFLMWSHGKGTLCGERGFDLRRILTNVNMVAIFIGLALLLLGIKLPSLVRETMDSFGSMVGPLSMLVTGMLFAELDVRAILRNRRVWLVAALRLVVVPLVGIAFLKFSGIAGLVADGQSILLITLLATAAPSASTIVQLAQVYDQDPHHASAINVLTTLLCIASIPFMTMLYLM